MSPLPPLRHPMASNIMNESVRDRRRNEKVLLNRFPFEHHKDLKDDEAGEVNFRHATDEYETWREKKVEKRESISRTDWSFPWDLREWSTGYQAICLDFSVWNNKKEERMDHGMWWLEPFLKSVFSSCVDEWLYDSTSCLFCSGCPDLIVVTFSLKFRCMNLTWDGKKYHFF